MKRRILLWIMAVAATCSFPVAAQETELLPQVQAILYPDKPSDAYLKQDVFAGLLAFDAPQGMDYMAIGSRAIQSSFEHYMQSVKDRENTNLKLETASDYYEGQAPVTLVLEVNGQPYVFPCATTLSYDCVAQTLAQKETINKVIEQNPILMQRYEELKQLPHYTTYIYTAADPLPALQLLMRIRDMRLAQAMFAIEEGKVEQGLALLEKERAFDEKVFVSEAGIIEKMIAVRHWLTQAYITGVLLDYPAMKPYLATQRLQHLLSPLAAEQQKGIAQALVNERDMMMRTINQIPDDGYAEENSQATTKQYFNRNKTENLYYLMFEALLERASMPIHEVSQFVLDDQDMSIDNEMRKILHEESQKMGVQDNNMGMELLEFSILSDMFGYNERFYDAQVLLALVNAKRCLLAAQVDLQDEAAVNAFLAGVEEQGRNPYDQKPFKWHAEKRMLGTDLVSERSARILQSDQTDKEVWINMATPQ